MKTRNGLVSQILQNIIFRAQQSKYIHTGSERNEDELLTEFEFLGELSLIQICIHVFIHFKHLDLKKP